jgi:hypothetical protein
VTIRAKLYAAIALTVLGPIVTTGVALHGMGQMTDRFDEVRERAHHRALALELQAAVTDFNGWQTAYGYDGGRSRPEFVASVAAFRKQLRTARRELRDPAEQRFLDALARDFRAFMRGDRAAFAALRAGDEERVQDILLGPEIVRFRAMAVTTGRLAGYEARRAAATERRFDDARDDARRRLIAVGLGAGFVIVLLLVTANDIARMALEGERRARRRSTGTATD